MENQGDLICEVTNCDKPIKAKNLCDMHYTRLRRNGSLERTSLDHSIITTCLAIGCKNEAKTSGLCAGHYSNLKKVGSPYRPQIIRLCSIKGCERPHQAKGLCNKHYHDWREIISYHGL